MFLLACLRRAALAAASCFSLVAAAAQVPDTAAWTRFEKKAGGESTYGYRDAGGRVRLPATFGTFTPAVRFRRIMAVQDAQTGRGYYLLKSGRVVGRDSVYMSSDYEVACESEGTIVFLDKRKDRVGFLNALGKPLIPAVYNYATPFHNGLAIVRSKAHKRCLSGEADTVQCEHPGWKGGRTLLINPRNEVLLDAGKSDEIYQVNLYSLQVNPVAVDTAVTSSFQSVSGDRYVFINYEKEFAHWLYNVFVPAVQSGEARRFGALCFEEVAVSNRPFRGWPHYGRATFVAKYYQPVLYPRLRHLRQQQKNVYLFLDDLNQFIFNSRSFPAFYTDCGEPFQAKYPAFEVAISYAAQPGQPGTEHQEHFDFIRTTGGYRLFSVSL